MLLTNGVLQGLTRLRKKLENLAIAIKIRNINDVRKYAKNTILILAGKSNNKGAVLLGENIPMSLEDLAKVMHKTLPKLTRIIQALCELDMIFVEDDTIFVKNWSIYQNADELDKIRENGRKRTQKFRANQKKCNVTETLRNTEEKNKEENIIRREDGTQIENESGFKD